MITAYMLVGMWVSFIYGGAAHAAISHFQQRHLHTIELSDPYSDAQYVCQDKSEGGFQ